MKKLVIPPFGLPPELRLSRPVAPEADLDIALGIDHPRLD